MKNKNIIILLVVAAVGFVAYYLYRRSQTESFDADPSQPFSAAGTVPVPSAVASNNTILKRGDNSPAVGELQRAYNELYAGPNNETPLVVDNAFGPLTEAAIRNATGKTAISVSEFRSIVGGADVFNGLTSFNMNSVFGFMPTNAPFLP